MRVSVVILCYNLEDYIERAIKGVLMQRIDFDLQVIVCNDGSTDKSKEIIDRYASKIEVIHHEVNQGLMPSRVETFDKCTGDYITICDGDDQWIDEYKLQKQVNFMNDNPKCGLVHTGFEVNDEIKGENVKVLRSRVPEGRIFESMLFNNKISSCTALFRRKYWLEIDRKAFSQLKGSEDRFLWMEIAQKSDIGYIQDVTGIYTKRRGSMSGYKDNAKQSLFAEESYDIRYYFIDRYGCLNALQKILYRHAIKLAESIKNESMGNKALERLKKVI